MSAPALQPRHAPLPLWRAAGELITAFFNLFGAPEAIAAEHTLLTEPRKLLLKWLRAAEAMVRQLLLIEASAYAKSVGPPASSRQCKMRIRKRMEFFADRPEDWRVSFRCFLSSPACGGSGERLNRETKGDLPRAPSDAYGVSSPASAGDKRFHSAWPLAERAEAMLRVYNNPAPYAARLARRLYVTPARTADVALCPDYLGDLIDFEHFCALREGVVTARRPFAPS